MDYRYLVLIAWIAGFLLIGIPVRSLRRQLVKQVDERLGEEDRPFHSRSLWSIFTLMDLFAFHQRFYPDSPQRRYYAVWYLIALVWFVAGTFLLA
jgi:hypothetical protein